MLQRYNYNIMQSSDQMHQPRDEKTRSHSYDEFDLRRDYQSAIECIVQCESIISSLQEQVASKDEHVASLEAKIVQMSLELASSKAFEDQHRSKRRVSADCNDDDVSLDDDDWKPQQLRRRSIGSPVDMIASFSDAMTANNDDGAKKKHQQKILHRASCCETTGATPPSDSRKKLPFSWSTGSMSWGGMDFDEDDEDDDTEATQSTTTGEFNLSNSSRMSINFGHFFRKNRNGGANGTLSELEEANIGNEKQNQSDRDRRQNLLRSRRPRNTTRMEVSQLKTSLTSIEGVVFPHSFEEVVNKGCIDPRDSLKKAKSLRELNLPNLR